VEEVKPLSNKKRRFIEAYIQTWNASEAARQAGYKQAYSQGPRLLDNVEVKAAIEQRLEQAAMQSNEVLARLAEQARVNIADFIITYQKPIMVKGNDKPIGYEHTAEIDWIAVQARGHLIKSITPTDNGMKLELHDGQVALITIGKHLQLFKDTEAPGVHLHIDGLGELLDRAYGTDSKPDGQTTDSTG
jgi:phage terminase small subunit